MELEFLLMLLVLFFLIILVIILSIYFIIPFLFGAPFEATKNKTMKTMIKFASIKKEDRIAELGSGNGKIIFEIIKKYPKIKEIHGFEINPFLVLKTKIKIKKLPLPLREKIFIHWKSFWKEDLSKYNKILFFQYKTIMSRLEKKVNNEVKKDSKIISNWWRFPNLKPKKQEGTVYLYEK